MKTGDTATLEVDRIDESGRGLGEHEGHEVHALGLVPPERGRVLVEHVSPHRPQAWARCIERLGEPSPQRAEPICPAFGECGGCAWQHLTVAAQLDAKRARVRAALAARLDPAPHVAGAIAAPSPWGYRNRGKYVVSRVEGALVLGAYRPRTHQVVSTLGCAVVDPVIDRTARQVCERLSRSSLEVYDETTRAGQLRYVIIRTGVDGEALVVLVTTRAAAAAELAAIAGDLDVAGVVWHRNDSTGGALLAGESQVIAGRGTVLERFGGIDVALGPSAFAQVNREAAAAICCAIATAVPAGSRVVDLYCGAGAIALHLAAAGCQVTGIDDSAEAIAAARAATGGLAGLRFERGDAGDVIRLDADVVVVNPPRKGLARQIRQRLAATGPPLLVYLSCGPESLARDLAELVAAGYRVESVQPFDLMPGTAQIETLVVCRRGDVPSRP